MIPAPPRVLADRTANTVKIVTYASGLVVASLMAVATRVLIKANDTSSQIFSIYNLAATLAFLLLIVCTHALVRYLKYIQEASLQTHSELQYQKNFLQMVIDGLPAWIGYWDKNLNNQISNKTYADFFKKTPEQIRGKHVSELVPPDIYHKNLPQMTSALNGVPQIFEREIILPSGEVKSALANYIPNIQNDEVVGFFVIVMDISTVKKMETELWATNELRRAILDSTNYSVIATDPSGLIHTFNRAAEKMLKYQAAEIIGKTNPGIFHDLSEVAERAKVLSAELKQDIQPGFEAFVAKSRLGTPDENEWTYIRKDGSRFPVRLSVTALKGKEGELVGFLGIAQDISEIKRHQLQLMDANQKALAAAKAKSEFLANMSHEIRTPMNGVIGICNLLLDSIKDPIQIDYLKTIQQSGNTLLDLINGILDFSKIEAGKIELEDEPFNLHHATQDVLDLLKYLADQKNITLSYTPNPKIPNWVSGDVTRFRQILTNLVSNAIKFTIKGSVTITSDSQLLPDGKNFEIKYTVIDTGIGIPTELRPRLFNSFSQIDASTTRKFGGTGLGLAICKGLCEKMGGSISFESEAGKGSQFSFTFTVKASPKNLNQPLTNSNVIPSDFSIANPLRILVAEDNRTNQLVITGLLTKLGYRPDVVANGQEVLSALQRKTYDLILMDCHMPEMDGFETTQKIRANPTQTQPQIVALTASVMQEDVNRCIASGMNAFLSKPIVLASLLKTLQEIHQNTTILSQSA